MRLRDNGTHNRVHILNAYAEGDDAVSTAIVLATTIGEENFDGGVGSAKFADYVYCSATITALASGTDANFFLYHGKVAEALSLTPVSIIPKNEGALNNDIEMVAFADTGSNNRQIRVKAFNKGSAPYTGTLFFWVKVGG